MTVWRELPFGGSGTVVLSGDPAVGEVLHINAPVGATLQWLRNGTPIAGQTSSDYTVVGSDQGKEISCRYTVVTAGLDVPSPPAGTLVFGDFPIVSRGRPVDGSGDGGYPASAAVDGTTQTTWRSYPVFPSEGTPARLAIDVRGVVTDNMWAVLLNPTRPSWNRVGGLGSGGVGASKVSDYVIQGHPSSGGTFPAIDDAGWVDLITPVVGNRWSDIVHTDLDLTGIGYVQAYVTSSTGPGDNGDVGFTAFEIRDASGGHTSIMAWGASIEQGAMTNRNEDGGFYDAGTGPIDVVLDNAITGYDQPVFVVDAEGGYGINTYYDEFEDHLDQYPVDFVFSFNGINDANGWASEITAEHTSAQDWKGRFQEIIDYGATQGKKFILPTMVASHNNAYTRANILVVNQLIGELIDENPGVAYAGPDLFSFFDAHLELFRVDDLHLNDDQAGPIYTDADPWVDGDPPGRYDDGTGPLTGAAWLLRLVSEWTAAQYV